MKFVWFLSLFSVAFILGPSLAHLLELFNKIDLPREEYFIVQQIYRGWALLAIPLFVALGSTLALVFLTRSRQGVFSLVLVAFLGLVVTQVIFWTWTYPTNTATANWTQIPENWERLRAQWEYSHGIAACINLFVVALLITGAIRMMANPRQERQA